MATASVTYGYSLYYMKKPRGHSALRGCSTAEQPVPSSPPGWSRAHRCPSLPPASSRGRLHMVPASSTHGQSLYCIWVAASTTYGYSLPFIRLQAPLNGQVAPGASPPASDPVRRSSASGEGEPGRCRRRSLEAARSAGGCTHMGWRLQPYGIEGAPL